MRPRILIADDSKFFQKFTRSAVEGAGFEVVACADDGLQALQAFKTHMPNVVLLDITMPNMSGKECLKEIIKINPHAKVIMLSGLTNPELELECLRIGAKAFLSKSQSESPDALKQAIVSVISMNAAA